MATRLEYSVTAKCKPEHVWQKFHKLEEWPWWNRVVGRAKWLSGKPWDKGSQFLMDLVYPRKISFRPTIIEAAPPNRVGWVGKTTGFTGEHWFSFEAQPDGTTLIKTWEDISGLMPALFLRGMKQSLAAMHKDWLEALKAEAEKIAREELARS
jgi:hypothetical protein